LRREAEPRRVDELTLAPTPAQQRFLAETMTRFNTAAEAVAGVGFARALRDPEELLSAAREELARHDLPVALRRLAVERAARELRGAKRKPKLSRFQAVLYGDTVQWPSPDQARLWTVRGRRDVRVEPDPRYGWIRSPLEGRPVSLQRRGDRFVLAAEDREQQ
jgi:hypothetical protein